MTTEQTPAAPILSITWDTVLGIKQVGYDEDNGPEVEPLSLADMVVEAVARQYSDQLKRDVDNRWYDKVQEIRAAVSEAVKAEAAAMVREQLNGVVTRTNSLGQPTGEPQTLADLVREDIAKYLAEPAASRNGYGPKEGGFRELLRTEIQQAMNTELASVIRNAREQVVTAVREQAADLIATSVREGMVKR